MFLCRCTVTRTDYMLHSKEFEDLRLVRADSAEEAEIKYQNYWLSRSRDYDVSYGVTDLEVLETVE